MTEGNCPSCGAPIQFKAGSAAVQVCPFCNTVIGRTDRTLEARGKIAAIVDTDSPLQLRARGVHDGDGYTLVGHLQKDYGKGPWDEWYVEFDDGRTAWISESEGWFHLLFTAPRSPHGIDGLRPGTRIRVTDPEGEVGDYVVEERGSARIVSAAGELPDDLEADAVTEYVDATGEDGRLCTLDFGTSSENPEVFIGHRVSLEHLGIAPDELRPRRKKVALQAARCTECNAPVELRAPDQTMRVACPSCGALLDASRGKLSLLKHLEKPKHEPAIPLGQAGKLEGAEWICIGFLVRSCVVDGVTYPWDEYLLYNPERGFAWMMLSNGHWVFLEPIAAGTVYCTSLKKARYQNRDFVAFQKVTARTDFVLGEFYWEVEAGEQALAIEYIAPPHSLNEDRSGNEITWTYGTYLQPAVVKEAFGLKEVPVPRGVAPSQPNPSKAKAGSAFGWAALWSGVLIALYIFFAVWMPKTVVFDKTLTFPGRLSSGTPETMYFSQEFEIPKSGNVLAEVSASPLNNSWMGIEGDLVNVDTGEVTSFYKELSYYSGTDSDGPWTEGSNSGSEYLSRVEAGRYTLRLVPSWDRQPSQYSVRLTSGVPRLLWVLIGIGALFGVSIFISASMGNFEAQRWSESNLAEGDD